jgi:CDI immunity proteins
MAPVAFDRSLTLDQLDPPAWGGPTHKTGLVITCHRLRRKPVEQFSMEDLRLMIGQEIGLTWLVPLALEILEQDPLACGDLYPGDLLDRVLLVGREFWRGEPELRSRAQAVLARVSEFPDELNDAVAYFSRG